MPLYDALISELTREADTTRRVLARVPRDRFAWKPHGRSMSLGQLALHVATLQRGVAHLLDELECQAPNFQQGEPQADTDLLAQLDESTAFAVEKLSAWQDAGLREVWTMKRGEQTLLQMPRREMVRAVMLNHWYHHRGQLTVYLRMLDVPVPSVYGPSADESPFAAAG
jgi:uncharacterized damage-inducible protein DinB